LLKQCNDQALKMNIFFLAWNPVMCASMHCDKHVVKMILETAQILCTTHRVMDGKEVTVISPKSGRRTKRWILEDLKKDAILYSSTHINHPSVQWTRVCVEHYNWLYGLFVALCDEYSLRYKKTHLCWTKLHYVLQQPPIKMICTSKLSAPPLAMPDYCKKETVINSYRSYYMNEKASFAKWTNRQVPSWFIEI